MDFAQLIQLLTAVSYSDEVSINRGHVVGQVDESGSERPRLLGHGRGERGKTAGALPGGRGPHRGHRLDIGMESGPPTPLDTVESWCSPPPLSIRLTHRHLKK